MASWVYLEALEKMVAGGFTWTSDVHRAMLLLATHTPNQTTHEDVADIDSDETTTGSYARQTLGSEAVNVDTGNVEVELDAADIAFGAIGATSPEEVEHCVVYTQVGGDDTTPATDWLIAKLDFTPFTTNGSTVTVQLAAEGVLKLAA